MTDSIAGLPSRHIGMAHRRESSVSTNTSSCSSQTRVLPFATARAPQALGPSSRYAMARPRRVVTDNGKIQDPKRAAPRIAGRRHSAAIGTLLPVVGGSRTRAIIGLGLTLNPADAVVKLQPRNAAVARSQSIKQRQTAAADEPEIKVPEIKVAKVPVADLSPGLSLFASPRASMASSSPASLHSLRTGDPQPVTLPLGRDTGQKEAVAAEVASVEDLRSFVSCTSGVSPALPHVPQTPVTGAVRDALSALCTRSGRENVQEAGDSMLHPMIARNSVHIMQGRPAVDPPALRRSGDGRRAKHGHVVLYRRTTSRRLTINAIPSPPQQHKQLLPQRQSSSSSSSESNHGCGISNSTITRHKTKTFFAAAAEVVPQIQTLPTPPLPPFLHLSRDMTTTTTAVAGLHFPTASAQSSGTYDGAISESLGAIQRLQTIENSPSSTRTLTSERRQGRARGKKDDNRKAIEAAQPLIVATYTEGEPFSDRCTTHPGSRNDLWCETCALAVCAHCGAGAAHRTHAVATLAAAYDDTFEAVDGLQLDLVRHLGETRQHYALIDDASAALAADHSAALLAIEAQAERDLSRIDAARAAAEEELVRQSEGCAAWRAQLESALGTVQQMVDDLAPAQAVAERARMVRLLSSAAVRPPALAEPVPPPRLVEDVEPPWRHWELRVVQVMELGRRRGHVHVLGEPFAAHGAVWQAKASRSRTSVGEPSVALSVTCVEGPAVARAFRVAARVEGLGVDVAHEATWAQGSEHVFALCLLDGVAPALDEGVLVVRVGVQAASFRDLALAQDARIGGLEERVRALQEELAGVRAELASDARTHNRRRSEARGWATSPRAPPVPQIPLPKTPAEVDLQQHRRAASLTAKLRRQAPIPFPIATATATANEVVPASTGGASSPPPDSMYSQSSGLSDKSAGAMMRRLSGWVRAAATATTTRQPSRPRVEPPAEDVDGDWTFLDRTLSPGFEQATITSTVTSAATSTASPSLRVGRRPLSLWPSRGLINVSPPMVPVLQPVLQPPPLPALEQQQGAVGDAAELAAGFAFDGVADIEREQARVDERAKRRAQAVADIEGKYSALAQRLDKIQLIANTCENARDGDATLRRISSELGVLMTRRSRAPRPHALSPMRHRPIVGARDLFENPDDDGNDNDIDEPVRHARRAVTMDSRELARAIERSVGEPMEAEVRAYEVRPAPPSRVVSRRTSNSSVSSAASSAGGRVSGRITRPGGGTRRGSITGDSSVVVTPSKGAQQNQQQLTPRAKRQGGILKPGRTMRAKPVRLHPLAEVAAETQPPEPPGSPVARPARSMSIGDDDNTEPPARRLQLLRKCVRFPEELRLLETIRLIDPRAALSIESRVYEPPRATATADDDDALPLTGLAARVRYSPRLAPRRVTEPLDAESLLQLGGGLAYVRPPLPSSSSSSRGRADDMPFGALGLSRQRSPAESFVWAARGSLHVGPNVASAQSSPLNAAHLGPATSVSSFSSSEGPVPGASLSAHLYPKDLAAFGDAQIPAIACGRDTAFRASELTRHVQGPDANPTSRIK